MNYRILGKAILKTIAWVVSIITAIYGIAYGIMALQRLNSELLTGIVIGTIALGMFIYSVAGAYNKMKKKADIK